MSVVLATAGYDHKIRFWEAPSGICSRIIKFSDSQINKLEITPDKQFIAAAGNPTIRLYEISNAPTPPTGTNVNNNSLNANNSNYPTGDYNNNNPDGSGQQQQPNSNNQPPTQQAVLTLEGHTGNVTSLGFQKDGRYLYTGSEDGTIKVWDLRNPNYSRSFDCGSAVNSVTLRHDRDEFISGDQHGFVKIWDLASGKCTGSFQPAKVAFSVENNSRHHLGHHKKTSSNMNKNFMQNPAGSINSKRNYYPYSEGIVPIQSVDISEDSRTLVTISNHGTVFVWDPSTCGSSGGGAGGSSAVSDAANTNSLLRSVTTFRCANPGTYCLHGKIAPDCRHLVTTSSDGTAKLWDTVTWELTQTLIHISPTGVSNNSVTGRSLQQQQQNLSSPTRNGGGGANTTGNFGSSNKRYWVWDAAFCADSSYLVTACSDHVARLWNLRTGDVVRQYHGHQSSVTCVALNDCSI